MAYSTIVISVLFCVGISALTGKGYYCRDPDTGKLYPVNSTWPSTSFCGNYSCKLRKKDATKSVIPIREMIIDSLAQTTKAKAVEEIIPTENILKENPSTIITTLYPTLITETPIPSFPTTTLGETYPSKDSSNSIEMKAISNEQDRYLTDSEIKVISQLLHSVKKSDLEAIVDIYNLAQDIYKEMDKITSENIIEETINAAKNAQKESSGKRYWYEPLNRLNKAGLGTDMDLQGTNLFPTVVERSTADPNSYFQGTLTKNDFGTLPYYYPMSNFQREHSYVHATNKPQVQPIRCPMPPCPQSTPYPYRPSSEPPKYYQQPAPSYYPYHPSQTYGNIIKKPFPVETQKAIQPSVLLPYPFSYIQHNNMSAYPFNLYYDGTPWSHFDINAKNNDNYEKYFKAYLPQVSKGMVSTKIEGKPHQAYKEAVLENTETLNQNQSPKETAINKNAETKALTLKEDGENKKPEDLKKNLLSTLFESAKLEPKHKPDWQTDPLGTNILEEIKAHFEEKARLLKPFSLRKKAKLERVGKVLKLDDLNRDKRSADDIENLEVSNDEDFETYVERTTCPSEMDPGFYKMGNLTQPFPACCPRRIESNER